MGLAAMELRERFKWIRPGRLLEFSDPQMVSDKWSAVHQVVSYPYEEDGQYRTVVRPVPSVVNGTKHVDARHTSAFNPYYKHTQTIKARTYRLELVTVRTSVDHSPFPIDMLRYDQCFPADLRPYMPHPKLGTTPCILASNQAITICRISKDRLKWTIDRWAAYGFTVDPLYEARIIDGLLDDEQRI